jgi:M6 family metalloprotease-like protein
MNSTNFKKLILAGCFLLFTVSLSLAQGYIYTKAAPSGPDVSTTSTDFVDIPELSINFFQYFPSHIVINMSAEAEVSAGKRMFVRALVDGEPTASPSDVVFVNNGFSTTHSFIFSADVGGGLHELKMQYLVDGGGTAYLGDRTVTVTTAPEFVNTVAAPSGPDVSTTSGSFVDIPNLSYNINSPDHGDAIITITGEAETTNNKRMFVRAVVDGQPCEPNDVVFAAGEFKGTHSFTFVKKNLPVGSHSVRLQWMVDNGGTAFMGDRSFTYGFSNPDAVFNGHGGILSISAQSGASVTTTSGGFADIPDLSTAVKFPFNGRLVVSLSAEAYCTPGKRMFVRAVIDGLPLDPSDVVFTDGNFVGTSCMNFVLPVMGDDLYHKVALQWKVDGGGTAYLGDRNMTLSTSPAPCPDMTNPFNGVKPVIGEHPLLVILWDPNRPEHPAPSKADVRELIFGTKPSVRDYFIANSNNLFFLNKAEIKGWYNANKPWNHYWGPEDTGDSDGDGWISGHVEKWAEAVRKANPTFDFASFDVNGDGTLQTNELGILMVIPQNNTFGTVRVPLGRQHPSNEPLIVDGVIIPLIAEAYIGSPPDMGLIAHELSHLYLNLPDMYYNFFFPHAAGVYSLMDADHVDNHIDPFHKIRLGWMQPAIVWENTCIPIEAVETSHVAFVLCDPKHGAGEYFIVENRCPNLNYDSNLPDQGLAVWHIIEDPDIYKNLSAPAGVNAADWASIGANDWGRRVIRMIRPVYGPPFNNSKALWDGSDPETGYDLLSDDPDPSHATLKWADGTPSGFAIKNISAAGPHMEACVEVPIHMQSSVKDISVAGKTRPKKFLLEQNYPNPFNPETMIPFNLNQNSKVTVKIFNVLGQEMITLLDRDLGAGKHVIQWNGTDNNGVYVSSGVYFYQVESNGNKAVRKMMLMR